MKKYRITKVGDYLGYKVETKSGWLSEWRAVSEYRTYDEPRKVKKYGGFFGDIVTEVTETGGSSTRYFPTVEEAKQWITDDKRYERERKTRRRDPDKVVHQE